MCREGPEVFLDTNGFHISSTRALAPGKIERSPKGADPTYVKMAA